MRMNQNISALLLSVALLGGCVSVANDAEKSIPRGDSVLSDFYVVPKTLPASPGVLIRHEPLDANLAIKGAAQSIRILYSSTDGLSGQDRIAVSGTLYMPLGTAPDGGWPLMMWSHGTVGIADRCTPSFRGRGDRQVAYLSTWLKEGYAVLASDYQGLGTSGGHPYMSGRPMAYSNLDAIRAVQSADFNVSRKVVITGQSQGASGAISTAGFAQSYAPDVDLAGLVTTGIPYFTEDSLAATLDEPDLDTPHPNLALSLYSLTMAEMVDPDFKLRDIVADDVWSIVSQVDNACVFDFIGTTMNAGLTPRNAFKASYIEPMKTAFRQMIYPTLEVDVPMFAGTGLQDQITPAPMQQAFVSKACNAGVSIKSRVYETDHNGGLLMSVPDAQSFVQDVFAGRVPENNCPQ